MAHVLLPLRGLGAAGSAAGGSGFGVWDGDFAYRSWVCIMLKEDARTGILCCLSSVLQKTWKETAASGLGLPWKVLIGRTREGVGSVPAILPGARSLLFQDVWHRREFLLLPM